MTAIPDFSIRMQVAGMRGLLSEIIAVGALSKHGDTDLMERVREAADTPLPELPTRGCLAQIEEPAQPVLYVSPGQLANHSNPEGPESEKTGRYLPARVTPAGKFTQPLYAGAAPADGAPRARDLLGIVRTAQSEARRLINGEDSGSDLAQTKLDLPETLRVLEHALSQPAAVAGPARDWPDTCDGKEQEAFEAWAQRERHNMEQHPLHYLFLDAETNAARQGWKAGLLYAVEQMKTQAAPALEAPASPAAPKREVTDGTRTLLEDCISAIRDYAGSRPEEGESWESWFEAAFDLCQSRVRRVFDDHALAAAPQAAAAPSPGMTPRDKATQDQIASVMLQHGTPEQQSQALAYASGEAPAAPAVDVRVAIEKLPRYTYGYKSDEWGMNSHLTSYKAEDGKFLRRDDVLSAIAAQAKEGGAA